MVILGICQDKGLMDLLLQDARRLPAGLEVETFAMDPKKGPPKEIIKFYNDFDRITLLILDGEHIPASVVHEMVEQSYAAFSYYRNNSSRWFKFLKNRLKPVSVDYQPPEFWFMLGSVYSHLIIQDAVEKSANDTLGQLGAYSEKHNG